MRYAIIGAAGSGKTAFGGFLAEALGTKAVDTSWWLARVETLRQNGVGLSGDAAWDAARNRPTRPQLVALGNAVCADDPGFLVRQAFKHGGVICGVRRQAEIDILDDDVRVILVERPEWRALDDDNYDIHAGQADLTVLNDTDIGALKRAAMVVAAKTEADFNALHVWVRG